MTGEIIILRDPHLGGTGPNNVRQGEQFELRSGTGEGTYDVPVAPLVGYWVKVDGKRLPRNLRFGVATEYGFAYRRGSKIGGIRRLFRKGWN